VSWEERKARSSIDGEVTGRSKRAHRARLPQTKQGGAPAPWAKHIRNVQNVQCRPGRRGGRSQGRPGGEPANGAPPHPPQQVAFAQGMVLQKEGGPLAVYSRDQSTDARWQQEQVGGVL
jgi:hypothetical protein